MAGSMSEGWESTSNSWEHKQWLGEHNEGQGSTSEGWEAQMTAGGA